MGADHVVVDVAVELDAQRAVVHGDFFEDAALDEEVDVFVDRGEGDCRDELLDAGVDFFRAGVAGHGLHDLVEHLALMGRGEAVVGAEFAEGFGCEGGGRWHQELVNDNNYRSVKGDARNPSTPAADAIA